MLDKKELRAYHRISIVIQLYNTFMNDWVRSFTTALILNFFLENKINLYPGVSPTLRKVTPYLQAKQKKSS